MTNNNTQLLTAREAAQQLRVSTETILRWVREDKIPAIKLPGGAIRLDADRIEGLHPRVIDGPAGSIEERLDRIERYLVAQEDERR